jgi:sigma-B regulation protein RsbU (phosphoserine phosphatase)
MEANNNAHLVFEEIVNNISRYGFDDGREHPIEITGDIEDAHLTLTFDDAGRPFDPRTQPAAKPAGSLEEATIGGRGILLVRAAARRLDYQRTASGHNRFTVTLARS